MGLENEQSPEKEKQGSHSLLQSGIPELQMHTEGS